MQKGAVLILDGVCRAGGLEENVTEQVVHAAFIPFGDVKDISMPLDQATQKHRGFCFITYFEKEDAAAAMDNMHNGELYGRVLTVNFAQPQKIKGGEQGWASQAGMQFCPSIRPGLGFCSSFTSIHALCLDWQFSKCHLTYENGTFVSYVASKMAPPMQFRTTHSLLPCIISPSLFCEF